MQPVPISEIITKYVSIFVFSGQQPQKERYLIEHLHTSTYLSVQCMESLKKAFYLVYLCCFSSD